jgi:hypothetical protein
VRETTTLELDQTAGRSAEPDLVQTEWRRPHQPHSDWSEKWGQDNPLNETDPSGLCPPGLGFACSAVELAEKTFDHRRLPDYVSFNFDVVVPILGSQFGIGGGGNFTVTRNGHVYWGPQGEVGVKGLSSLLQGGWIDQYTVPSSCQIDQFVGGWGLSGSAFVPAYPEPFEGGIGPVVGATWGKEGTLQANAFSTNIGVGVGAGRTVSVAQGYNFRAPFSLPGW